MTIGEKILNLRKARGWSQEELAGWVGVTRQAVSRWEADSAKPDADKIVALCTLFGISSDYLLGIKQPEQAGAVKETTIIREERIVAVSKTVRDRKLASWLLIPVSALLMIAYFLARDLYRGNIHWLFWLSTVGLIIGLAIGPLEKQLKRRGVGRKIGWVLFYLSIPPAVTFIGYFGLLYADWEWEIIYPTLAAMAVSGWLLWDHRGEKNDDR